MHQRNLPSPPNFCSTKSSAQYKHTNMYRIPIIPGNWAANKVASLLCDDVIHITSTGEPKLVDGSTQAERECCSHPRKLLLLDEDHGSFCIVHDPGVGIASQPSGQWWVANIDSEFDIHKARVEYVDRMTKHDGDTSNWWDTIGSSIAAHDHGTSPQPKATSGLSNEVSKREPSPLPPWVR